MAPALDDSARPPPKDLIPVIDLAAFTANPNDPAVLRDAAAQLRTALETIGFFFLVNHGVDWKLVESVYGEAKRLHATPEEVKGKVKFGGQTGGYLTLGGGTSYASKVGESRFGGGWKDRERRDRDREKADFGTFVSFLEQLLKSNRNLAISSYN